MTLENLRALARAMCPGAKVDVANNTVLDLILNTAVIEITSYAECLPTNKKFNAVASQGTVTTPYILSTVFGDYLRMAGGGLWWNSGSVANPSWKKLNPRTIEWLDENRPNWHEISDGSPEDYAIDADNLYVVPAPASSLTSGFWSFYTKKPINMVAAASYPFSGSTVEYAQLSIFDMAILYRVRSIVAPMLNKEGTENLSYQEYKKELADKNGEYKSRPDIAQVAIFQGPIIR